MSDLEKVTKQAYAMVSIYGLNEKIGNISYFDSRGADMFTKPYSDDRARVIDEEVSKMIEAQYTRALNLLSKNKDKLTELANKLLSHEVIFKEDLETIFGKREWEDEKKEPFVSTTNPEEKIEKNEPTSLIEPMDTIEDQTETKKETPKSSDSRNAKDEINEEDLND